MKCLRCDQPIKFENEHYKDVRYDDGTPLWECSGWTCDAKDWRGLYFDAAAKLAAIEAPRVNIEAKNMIPNIKLETYAHLRVCNCCGVEGDTIQQLVLGWVDGAQGGSTSVSLCAACRQRVAAVVAAPQPTTTSPKARAAEVRARRLAGLTSVTGLCTCEWPVKVMRNISGHATTCPAHTYLMARQLDKDED